MYKTLDYTVKNPLLEAAYNYIKLYKNITFQKNTIWEATEKIIKFDKMKRWDERICNWMEDQDSMIQITAAPHAVYTVSGENLQKLYRLARDHGRRFHIHVSETRKEVEDCMKAFGMTPVLRHCLSVR